MTTTKDSSLTVALLGTVTMGAGMAQNITAAGITLRVWNRTSARAEPLAAYGATVCGSVAEAVTGADVVVTMLWDGTAVEDALRSGHGSYTPQAVLLQMSTVGVDGAAHLAEVADELGLRYVDAPVLGTKKPAEDGALVVLASGDAELRATVQPVLDAVGQRTLWLGRAGDGSRLKLAANALVITLLSGIGQSLALTRDLGLDPALLLQAVDGGAMSAPYVQLKGKAMIAGEFVPATFALDGAAKDADLITAAAQASGTDVSVLQAAREQQQRAMDAGHGNDDMAAVYVAFQDSGTLPAGLS